MVWLGEHATSHQISDITRENERIHRFKHEAGTDFMTGLYNRRYGQSKVEKWMHAEVPFVLCFADVDGLKKVNDIFGRNEGNRYIQRVTDAQVKTFHQNEMLCRFGGDAFILFISGYSEEPTRRKMNQALACLPKNGREAAYRMGFSYGVETIKAGDARGIKEIADTADVKMHLQKTGYNRPIYKKTEAIEKLPSFLLRSLSSNKMARGRRMCFK